VVKSDTGAMSFDPWAAPSDQEFPPYFEDDFHFEDFQDNFPNLGLPDFPVSLPEYFIKGSTNEGDIVLDPFMGTGTTAIAALNLKRNYLV
jgi:hypothetical protein